MIELFIMIEYGVAFFCNKEISDFSYEVLNKLLVFDIKPSIDDSHFPHITLYQGLAYRESLDFLALEIKHIFKEKFNLKTDEKLFFTNPISNIFLSIKQNSELQKVHESILEIGKRYGNGLIRPSVLKTASIIKNKEDKASLLENHGIYFGKRYLPHITIAKNEKFIPEILEQTFKSLMFEVDTIVIGLINEAGQMSKDDVLLRIDPNV